MLLVLRERSFLLPFQCAIPDSHCYGYFFRLVKPLLIFLIFFCISPTLLYIIYPLVSHHIVSVLTGSNSIIHFCSSRNFISNFLSVLVYLYPLYSCSSNFWNPFLYIYLQFPRQLCRKKSIIRRRRKKRKKFYCTLRDFSRVNLWQCLP